MESKLCRTARARFFLVVRAEHERIVRQGVYDTLTAIEDRMDILRAGNCRQFFLMLWREHREEFPFDVRGAIERWVEGLSATLEEIRKLNQPTVVASRERSADHDSLAFR